MEYDDMTIAEARLKILAERDKGTECPCCGRLLKVYARKLNSTMARALIWLVRTWLTKPRWVNIHESGDLIPSSGGDFAKLVFWGLIEDKPNDDDRKRASGWWRPTELGVSFAERAITLSSHVLVYCNAPLAFSDKLITVDEALGEDFSYRELMEEWPRDLNWLP